MADTPNGTEVNQVLVKLRASTPLAAATANANLRPVFDRPFTSGRLGADSAPQWFIADVPDLAISPRRQANPWDFAHARLADQLGVDEDDLIFAEPDRVHDQAFHLDSEGIRTCTAIPQDGGHGKAVGPGELAWHLGEKFSQLAIAREAVRFTEPRVRIGHLDTGYDLDHDTLPKHLLRELGRSFVEADRFHNSAVDPNNEVFLLDNSGTGPAPSAFWLAGLPARRLRWPSVEPRRPRSCRCGSLIGWCCCAQAHWPRVCSTPPTPDAT
jgi:hypothetical protein